MSSTDDRHGDEQTDTRLAAEYAKNHPVAVAAPPYESIYTELPDGDWFHSGWGVIVKGADITPEQVEAALRDQFPCDQLERVVSKVEHLQFHRRVKWCSRIDGFGCDMEGEWHGHWSGVKHNDTSDCCHTVALPIFAKNHPKPDTTEEQK